MILVPYSLPSPHPTHHLPFRNLEMSNHFSKLTEPLRDLNPNRVALEFVSFFFFGFAHGIWKFPGLGIPSELQLRPTPQLQQSQILNPLHPQQELLECVFLTIGQHNLSCSLMVPGATPTTSHPPPPKRGNCFLPVE